MTRHFEDSFKAWVRDPTITFGAQDLAWTKLRTAMLLAGYAADRSGWKNAASLLARRQLMNAEDDESAVWALDLLRLAGAKKWLKPTVRRMLQVGPVSPLVRVGSDLDLAKSTRSSLATDLAFVEGSADVLAVTDCDRCAAWALDVLADPAPVHEALRPMFFLESAVLDMLRALVPAVSPAVRRKIAAHVIDLPAVEDQLVAKAYGRVLARVPHSEWTQEQLDALEQRPADDNWELKDDIDRLLAIKDPTFRSGLEDRIAAGEVSALHSYGKVTDLPSEAAGAMIAHLSEEVQKQIHESKRGAYGLGGYDLLDALVVLNVWHPEVADWSSVEASLALPNAHGARTYDDPDTQPYDADDAIDQPGDPSASMFGRWEGESAPARTASDMEFTSTKGCGGQAAVTALALALLAGPRVGLPVPAAPGAPGITEAEGGTIAKLIGTILSPTHVGNIGAMVGEAKTKGTVIWPNPKSTKAINDHNLYNVYQLYYTDNAGEIDAYKYGITKTSSGDYRPKRQIPTCNRNPETNNCQWGWLRQKVPGWWIARVFEAGYLGRYILRKGRNPIGMRAGS